jgi:hypothetical protein
MATAKKRPSKKAKAAKKILNDSKMLSEKAGRDSQSNDEFRASIVSPRTNTKAIKPRPDKKRG